MTCWAQSGCQCGGKDCPYVCPDCGQRLAGALGHGPACQCPTATSALAVTLSGARVRR